MEDIVTPTREALRRVLEETPFILESWPAWKIRAVSKPKPEPERYYWKELPGGRDYGVYGPDGWIVTVDHVDQADLITDALWGAYLSGKEEDE
jgi:hypothetical protein